MSKSLNVVVSGHSKRQTCIEMDPSTQTDPVGPETTLPGSNSRNPPSAQSQPASVAAALSIPIRTFTANMPGSIDVDRLVNDEIHLDDDIHVEHVEVVTDVDGIYVEHVHFRGRSSEHSFPARNDEHALRNRDNHSSRNNGSHAGDDVSTIRNRGPQEQVGQRRAIRPLNRYLPRNLGFLVALKNWSERVHVRLGNILSEYVDMENLRHERWKNLKYTRALSMLFSMDLNQLKDGEDDLRARRVGQQRVAMQMIQDELEEIDKIRTGGLPPSRTLEQEYVHAYRLLDHLHARGELRLELSARVQSAIDERNRQEQMDEAWSLSDLIR